MSWIPGWDTIGEAGWCARRCAKSSWSVGAPRIEALLQGPEKKVEIPVTAAK